MTSNNTEATSTFGELSWNISKTVSVTVNNIINYFNICGVLLEITIIVFFIANFSMKNSYFRRPYFVILTMGCIVDAIPKFQLFLSQYFFKGNIISYYISPPLNWYNANFITLCNLMLALNRFSAVVFPLYFSKIWTKRKTAVICILLALYPFLIHSYNPVNMLYTFNRQIRPSNVGDTDFEHVFEFASDIVYAILATTAGIIAALYLIIKKKMKDKNIEKVLLAQSITSSIFLIFSTVSSWLASVNRLTETTDLTDRPEVTRLMVLQVFFLSMSKLFYSFHHYTGLILLVTMSKKFRIQYLNFYKLSYIFGRCRNKITPQPNMTTTVITLTNRANSY